MSMSSNDQLKQAVVDSVEHGTYPEPEVSSAELPSTLLPALLAHLQTARHEVKVRRARLNHNLELGWPLMTMIIN
jgi:hypothetical protein